jgi:predicted type IV restriction endonuclease
VDKRIKTLIQDIRSNERITTFDEATTKQAIILRLLSELGWHIFNTEEVKPEYSVSNKRVDYALRINNTNKVFLEIKKVTEDIERHQNQLLDYSFQEGVKLAILTNGISWWFYLPLNEGSWDQRKYFAIDILQQDPEDTAKRFIDFLSKDNVATEGAIKLAESLLKGRVKEIEIQKNLPKAWNKIISQPDELLIELINETLEKICGYKAESEQVIKFINEHINASITHRDKPLTPQHASKKSLIVEQATEIIEIILSKTDVQNQHITIPKRYHYLFPPKTSPGKGYEAKRFTILDSDGKEYKTHIEWHNRLPSIRPFFRKNQQLKKGDKIYIDIIIPMERYRLRM